MSLAEKFIWLANYKDLRPYYGVRTALRSWCTSPRRLGPSLGRGHRELCRSKRVRKSASTDAAIGKALKNGDIGIREIATTLRVDTGTLQRIKAKIFGLNAPKRYCRPNNRVRSGVMIIAG